MSLKHSEVAYSGRRQFAREQRDLPDLIYRTRREWIIGEWLIGVVSCATAMTGISGGLVNEALARTGVSGAWFWLFYLSGSAFIILSFVETRCRANRCARDVLIRYAYIRFAVHTVNFFCWVMAFLWLYFSNLNVASITYEALPLAAANFWGMVEHAKAMWLRPQLAKTTSMVEAGLRYFSRSN